jgi:NADH-quinone oxidoreductase subunit H
VEVINLILSLLLHPSIFVPLIFPGLITILVVIILLIWAERKIAAKIQMRIGPLYVTRRFGGVLQLLADLLRYMFAELIISKDSDKLMFIASPIIALTVTLLPLAVIPAGSLLGIELIALRTSIGLLAALTLSSLTPIFIIVMGWASNNKFALIGSLREGYLMISYEVPMYLSALSVAILHGSLDIVNVVNNQQRIWTALINPFAAFSFFTSMIMSTSRFPFEITESDSELVAGPYTEYSSILYGLVMGVPYMRLYVFALLFVDLFLGGWHPTIDGFSSIILISKVLIILLFSVFLRSVYPRYRLDQAIRIGWHSLFVLSLISIILSLLIIGFGGISGC